MSLAETPVTVSASAPGQPRPDGKLHPPPVTVVTLIGDVPPLGRDHGEFPADDLLRHRTLAKPLVERRVAAEAARDTELDRGHGRHGGKGGGAYQTNRSTPRLQASTASP